MLTSYLEIMDSAIKIGLGALITGGTSYLTARLNHKNERDKDVRNHKLRTLEMISEKCEAYFNCIFNFYYRANAIQSNDGTTGSIELNKTQLDLLTQNDEVFKKNLDGLHVAISKLRLLGANEAADLLDTIRLSSSGFRNVLMRDHFVPDESARMEHFNKYKFLLKEFNKRLSSLYSNV